MSTPKEFAVYYEDSSVSMQQLYKILLALDLYLQEKVSLTKAVELSGLSYDSFLAELRLRKIKRVAGYTVEDLEQENFYFQSFTKR